VPEPPTGARFGARAVLAFVAVAIVAVPFAVLVVLVTRSSAPLLSLDQDTADDLHRFALDHPTFTTVMRGVSAVGSSLGWWIVLTPLFAWLVYRRLPRLAAFVAVTALGSGLLNGLIKAAVDRARPQLVDPVARAAGKAFPSGHAQAATVGCGILLLVLVPVVARGLRPWLYAAAAMVVALIGFSRIALGVHYVSDVLGGVLIGAAWLLAMTSAFSAWRREDRRPPVRMAEGLEPEHRQQILPTEGPTSP
jgi:membrane-associated phospholipid phosphatase